MERMSEEKEVGFSSASLFLARKWEAVTQGLTMELWDRPPDAEENPGSRNRQRLGGKERMRILMCVDYQERSKMFSET